MVTEVHIPAMSSTSNTEAAGTHEDIATVEMDRLEAACTRVAVHMEEHEGHRRQLHRRMRIRNRR
jgi:hypothetical protein